MCEILVAVNPNNYTHPDPDKDLSGVYKRGYPVIVFDEGHSWGAEEGLPKFIIVKIPGVNKATIEQYLSEWKQSFVHTEISHNLNSDSYRWAVAAAAEGISVGGKGKIKQPHVQPILNNMGASIVVSADNEIRYDMTIFSSMNTVGFWDASLSGTVITELDYVKNTGVHTIQIDYSSTKFTAAVVESMILQKGGTIVSNAGGIVVFTIDRTSILNWFQKQVKIHGEKRISRRKYYLTNSFVQNAIDAGGIITVSSGTFVVNTNNLLNE